MARYPLRIYESADMVSGLLCPAFCLVAGNFCYNLFSLSATQVIIGVGRGGRAFENASYGFSIASLSLVDSPYCLACLGDSLCVSSGKYPDE